MAPCSGGGKSDKARRDEAGQVGLLVWGVLFGNSDMCGRDHQHFFCLNKHSKISPGVCEIRVVREVLAGQGTACEAKRTECRSLNIFWYFLSKDAIKPGRTSPP